MADFEGNATLHYYDMMHRCYFMLNLSRRFISAWKLIRRLKEQWACDAKAMDIHDSNVMMQRHLRSFFIENGMFAKHRKAMVEDYSEKVRWLRSGFWHQVSVKESFIRTNGCLRKRRWLLERYKGWIWKLNCWWVLYFKNAQLLERLDLQPRNLGKKKMLTIYLKICKSILIWYSNYK